MPGYSIFIADTLSDFINGRYHSVTQEYVESPYVGVSDFGKHSALNIIVRCKDGNTFVRTVIHDFDPEA